MIDERRKATYEDAKMSRAHFHAARIEELIEKSFSGVDVADLMFGGFINNTFILQLPLCN